MTPKQTPFTVPAGGSRSRQMYTSLGQATVKVSGADTQGAFVIFEVKVVPSGGPPFTCIMCRVSGSTTRGRNGVPRWGDIFPVSSGGCVFAPRMLPHTFQMSARRTPKYLPWLCRPAGWRLSLPSRRRWLLKGHRNRIRSTRFLRNTTLSSWRRRWQDGHGRVE